MAKRKQTLILISVLCLILIAFAFFFAPAFQDRRVRSLSMQSIQESAGTYDSYFLSMFPITEFHEEDFRTYEALSLMKLSYTIPDYDTLKAFFVTLQGNAPIKKIYLGLDPAKLSGEQATELIAMLPDTVFSIFLYPRSLDQWKEIQESDSLLSAYHDLTVTLISLPLVKVYPFFAQEWVIANPDNYLTSNELKDDIDLRIYLYSLFANESRDCCIREEDAEILFDQFHELIVAAKEGAVFFPDLSSRKIVFLGDSVIGNFTDRRSIPAYLHDLAGAATYNCGWGGATATDTGLCCLHPVLDALISGNLQELPTDVQAYTGLSQLYAAETPSSLNSPDTVFVLHYGINDYYLGLPLETSDPLDTNSFAGAMRNGITRLKQAFPQASIVIILPNHIFTFENGTEVLSDHGMVYEDYIDTLSQIALDYNLPVLDAYHQIINGEKTYVHVDDNTHPNDYGRFQIAYALMHVIAEQPEAAD